MSPGRRSRRAASLTVSSVLFIAASEVFAQDASLSLETPLSGAFEFKGSNYTPRDIDLGGGELAYEDFFGSDSIYYIEFSIERYLWQRFGSIGLGLHLGYSSRDGQVRQADGAEGEAPGETNFRVIPLRAALGYYYDYSAIHHGIPLVPFVRAGLDYHLWRMQRDGETSTARLPGSEEVVSAAGGKFGWHASGGVRLLLDTFSPPTAAAFDVNWGINNSYIFGEYRISRVDDFGDPGHDLSDEQVLFGLAFDY